MKIKNFLFTVPLIILAIIISILGMYFSSRKSVAPKESEAAMYNNKITTFIGNKSSFFDQNVGLINGNTVVRGVNFGPWAMLPVDDKLYVGYGANGPSQDDGALLAVVNSRGQISPILGRVNQQPANVLSEQGIESMVDANGTIYIAGPDATDCNLPDCSDNWLWGNGYTYNPSDVLKKFRNIQGGIHTATPLYNEATNKINVVASKTNGTFWQTGEIIKNPQGIVTHLIWQRSISLSHDNYNVSVQSSFQNGNNYYIVTSEVHPSDEPSRVIRLRKTTDGGLTWNTLINIGPANVEPLFYTSAVKAENEIMMFTAPNRVKWFNKDNNSIRETTTNFNIKNGFKGRGITNDNMGNIYVITTTSKLMKYDITSGNWILQEDLSQRFGQNIEFVSLAYWPFKNSIMINQMGANNKIIAISLDQNALLKN